MGHIYRIKETETDSVSADAAVNIGARDYAWTARIVADVMVFVLVDDEDDSPEATNNDFPVIEFEEALFSVGKGEEISVLGSDTGNVWVSEIRCSS